MKDFIKIFDSELIIEPGVLIHFEQNAGLELSGNASIVAKGKSDDPIIFTGVEALPGFWQGIHIASISDKNTLEYTELYYAGGMNKNSATILIRHSDKSQKAKLSMQHTTVAYSNGYGVLLGDNGELTECTYNVFHNNRNAAIKCTLNKAPIIEFNNQFDITNGYPGVELLNRDDNLENQLTINALKHGAGYLLSPSIGLINTTLQPGVIFDVPRNGFIYIHRDFKAIGTLEQPIQFRGLENEVGYWTGIIVNTNIATNNELKHCIVSGGGCCNYWGTSNVRIEKANLNIEQCYGSCQNRNLIIITSCTFKQSGGCGIVIGKNTAISLDNNIFTDNIGSDICQ